MPSAQKEALLSHLVEIGVMARPVWGLINRQPMYRSYKTGSLPVAESLHASGISLPSSVTLKDEEIDYICHAILRFVRKAV